MAVRHAVLIADDTECRLTVRVFRVFRVHRGEMFCSVGPQMAQMDADERAVPLEFHGSRIEGRSE